VALINFTSRANKPLFAMLDGLMGQYGFEFDPQDSPGRPDIAVWQKALGPTLKAAISVSLNPALAPDTWSLTPVVMIDSSYVAHWYNTLRLYRDFNQVAPDYEDSEYRQVLRFFPAHIRWQERLDLKVPTLNGRLGTLDILEAEFKDVFDHYVMQVLEQIRAPLVLAELQLRAETEFPVTRIKSSESRYKVSNPYISTALLFDEAGHTARAVSLLKQAPEAWSRRGLPNHPTVMQKVQGQFDRLLEHLGNKLSRAEPGT